MEEAIYLKDDQGALYVAAKGHVTASHCMELRERVFARLESPPPPIDASLDLSECEYMDSTFLGIIVGIHKRLMKFSGKPLRVFGANETCMGLFRTMGIAQLLKVESEPPRFPSQMENLLSHGRATAELLMDAHEDLMKLSEENRRKFSTLYAILQNQANEEKGNS